MQPQRIAGFMFFLSSQTYLAAATPNTHKDTLNRIHASRQRQTLNLKQTMIY